MKTVKLGLMTLPLSRIISNKEQSRNNAFANNFMPLLEETTEFAVKWSKLYDSFLEEGIRDAVVVYEYMNDYYVREGNKRVSVAKFGGMEYILADTNFIDAVPDTGVNDPRKKIAHILNSPRWFTPISPLKAAFIYNGNIEVSRWRSSHEEGRVYADEMTGKSVVTKAYIADSDNIGETIERAVKEGNEIVFTISRDMLAPAVKAAA